MYEARGSIGYIDAGTAETWRPDFPEMQAFDQSCDGCLFGNPLSSFPDEYWLNINTGVKGINPNTGQLRDHASVPVGRDAGQGEGSEVDRRGRDRVRRRRRLSEPLGAVDQRRRATEVQRGAGEPRTPAWAFGRAEERPGSGRGAAALLRLRDRGGVLAIRRVRRPSKPGRPSTARRCSTWSTSWIRRRSARSPTRRSSTSTRSARPTTCSISRTRRAARALPQPDASF